jgi:hypothetical protein
MQTRVLEGLSFLGKILRPLGRLVRSSSPRDKLKVFTDYPISTTVLSWRWFARALPRSR